MTYTGGQTVSGDWVNGAPPTAGSDGTATDTAPDAAPDTGTDTGADTGADTATPPAAD
jgi:hypothetical protein